MSGTDGPEPDEGSLTNAERRSTSRALLEQLAEHAPGSPEAKALRDELVTMHSGLVAHSARRFAERGEPMEDLLQVGNLGLLKAIDGFESERGVEFSTYAVPTVIGEIRRHLRDRGGAIRIPRRLQQMRAEIAAASAEITQRLARSPTPTEIADVTGHSVEDIVEALESGTTFRPLSLDVASTGPDGTELGTLGDSLGAEDDSLDLVEVRESIKPMLAGLEPREKKVLLLRFFRNRTQTQIAEEIGVSQMHVSRILNKTLDRLREEFAETER